VFCVLHSCCTRGKLMVGHRPIAWFGMFAAWLACAGADGVFVKSLVLFT